MNIAIYGVLDAVEKPLPPNIFDTEYPVGYDNPDLYATN
jgi:hypothetical protein